MTEIILWSLLAFFGAFGLVEFIRFVYTDWNNSEDEFHIVVPGNKHTGCLEATIRNAMLATDFGKIIVIADDIDSEEKIILQKLQARYPHIEIMKTEEYISYLRD